MKKIANGKAWKFGHDLAMDMDIFPFQYVLALSRGKTYEEVSEHLMEPVNPKFGQEVRKGDFLVAGRNFAHGKAHSEGVAVMKFIGLSAVLADSIAPSFFKNALYYALPVLTGDGISKRVDQDDSLEVNIETGEIKNLTKRETFYTIPNIPPGHPLYPIMEAGGQIEYIKQRVSGSIKANIDPR